MKKLLALFLLILSLLKIENAKAYDFCVDGIYYNVLSFDDLTVEVTHGDNKYTGKITIPQKVSYKGRELSVVQIGYLAFSVSEVEEVEMPDGLLYIDAYAFKNCYMLKKTNISKSVAKIRSGTYENCISLTSIVIPSSIKTIETSAFYGCM